MAFQFKRKESATCAVRRVQRQTVRDALDCLKRCGQLEAIHQARRNIKKSRALLRLVRSQMARRDYRKEVRALRHAAKLMAAARDADVKVQALEKLRAWRSLQFPRIKKLLRDHCDRETRHFWKSAARRTTNLLRKVRRRAKHLTVDADGWDAIVSGLECSYQCGRELARRARRDSAPEHFHEWRKRVKDLWHQLRLLRPLWRGEICEEENELKTLGDCLGDEHDFFTLQQFVAEHSGKNVPAKEKQSLDRLIDARRKELRSTVLKAGRQFYGEKPASFCKRIENDWHTWRRAK